MERVRKQHYNEQLMGKKPREAKKKPIKIKYISSPMMVQASNALEFRAIVQGLTGQNSNIMEPSISSTNIPHHDDHRTTTTTAHRYSTVSGDAMSSWVGDVHDHHQPPLTHTINYENVDDQFSSLMAFLAQSDRHDDDHHQAHFTRSHVPESVADFQSPYHVFA